MLGTEDLSASDLKVDHPRLIGLRYGDMRFDAPMKSLCQMIDDCLPDASTLSLMGIDESFYRIVVAMMRPDLLFGDMNIGATNARGLDRVCQYIDAYLDTPLTLTTLEQVSGMSRRGLQYAFLKRFGCSPMEWVRERRLDLARARLSGPSAGTTVTSIALDCGFGHLANFTRRYRERFGEPPSETMARGRGKV